MNETTETESVWYGIAVFRRALGAALISALSLTAAGCGSSAADQLPVFPTTGKVSFKGQVPSGAIVALHPKGNLKGPNGEVVVPHAHVQPDGSYSLSSYTASDGAPAGDYAVTLEWHKVVKTAKGEPDLSPNLLPPQYSKPTTS